MEKMEITIKNKIVIEFDSHSFTKEIKLALDEIADALQRHKIVCDMSFFENINRTEYLNKYDGEQ